MREAFFFYVIGRCLIIWLFLFSEAIVHWNFSPVLQSEGNQEQPSRHGWLWSPLLCNSSWMEESLHPHPIITPVGLTVNKLGWQSAFDYCRCRPPGIQCLITPASQVDIRLITPAVWFFPVIAGSHEDLFFVFWPRFVMGRYLCVNISVWRFVEGVRCWCGGWLLIARRLVRVWFLLPGRLAFRIIGALQNRCLFLSTFQLHQTNQCGHSPVVSSPHISCVNIRYHLWLSHWL